MTLKKNKIFCTMLMLVSLSFLCAFSSVKAVDAVYDEQEYQAVCAAVEQYAAENPIEEEFSLGTMEDVQAYKLWSPKDNSFLTSLQKAKKMDDLISDRYSWFLVTENKRMVSVDREKDKWVVNAITVGADGALPTSVVNLEAVDAIAQELSGQHQDAPVAVAVIDTNVSGQAVCLSVEEEVFLIPYSARPEWIDLKNGELYTLEEACEAYLEAFPHETTPVPAGGGAASSVNIVPIVVVVALGAVVVLVVLKSRKRVS